MGLVEYLSCLGSWGALEPIVNKNIISDDCHTGHLVFILLLNATIPSIEDGS